MLIFYRYRVSSYFKVIRTVQAMTCDSFHKTNTLHVRYIYMTSVHCYIFRRSSAIFREPNQYL